MRTHDFKRRVAGLMGVMFCALLATPATAEPPDGSGLFAMPRSVVFRVEKPAPSLTMAMDVDATLTWIAHELQGPSPQRLEAVPQVFGFFEGFGMMVRGTM